MKESYWFARIFNENTILFIQSSNQLLKWSCDFRDQGDACSINSWNVTKWYKTPRCFSSPKFSLKLLVESVMWIYLLIIITSRITRSYQNDLRADFINQLSELRGWKTLAFIFDKDDSVQPWVTEILISKVLINLNDDFRPSLLEIDAYVYLHNSLALWHRLNRGVADGKVDPLKTFILFLSHHDKIQLKEQQNSELRKLDLILVSNIRHQRLIFQRHRETSTLPQQLNGRFDAINGLDANGMKITKDRSFSFQDQVVDVSAFLHPPTTSACQVGKGLCGRDINMIELMGEKLRFRPRFVKPPNNVKWGSFADGNWTGLVGELQRGAAEIGVANLFLAGPYLPHIEFSYPYGLSCSSFMVFPMFKHFLSYHSRLHVWEEFGELFGVSILSFLGFIRSI